MLSYLSSFLLILSSAVVSEPAEEAIPMPEWTKQVGAKTIPDKTTVFKVNDYGAVNDGKTPATKAIQVAIDACAAGGGGIVAFESGEYLSGSIFVKEGVNLRLDKNVTILGSQDIADYPEIEEQVVRALQDCGRKLKIFLSRRRREAETERKRDYIKTYIPHIGIGLREMLGFSEREEHRVVKSLTGLLERARDNK